jgi:hypothetical protein
VRQDENPRGEDRLLPDGHQPREVDVDDDARTYVHVRRDAEAAAAQFVKILFAAKPPTSPARQLPKGFEPAFEFRSKQGLISRARQSSPEPCVDSP